MLARIEGKNSFENFLKKIPTERRADIIRPYKAQDICGSRGIPQTSHDPQISSCVKRF